jgi:hypothetical protein
MVLYIQIKCSSDEASLGNPCNFSCGDFFRNSTVVFEGAFAFNLGVQTSLFVELMGAVLAIEIAFQKGWKHLWFRILKSGALCSKKQMS